MTKVKSKLKIAFSFMLSLVACSTGNAVKRRVNIDFLFFEGEDKTLVPFAINGSCAERGIFFDAMKGIRITKVRLDGKAVSGVEKRAYVDGTDDLKIDSPGPGFRYSLPHTGLGTWDLDKSRFIHFQLPEYLGANGHKTVEIEYQVACTDGSWGPLLTVFGKSGDESK